jgi:hypothetical protein
MSNVSDVDELLKGGASLRELSRHFDTRDDALNYYAAHQQNKHPPRPAASADICLTCKDAPTLVVEYRWRGILFDGVRFGALDALMLLLGHVGMTVQHRAIDFQTYHPACRACWRRTVWRKRLAPLINFFAFAGLLCGLLLAPLGFLTPVFGKGLKRDEQIIFVLVGIGGSLLILLYPFLMRTVRRMQIPLPLRSIPRKPFQYHASAVVEGDV